MGFGTFLKGTVLMWIGYALGFIFLFAGLFIVGKPESQTFGIVYMLIGFGAITYGIYSKKHRDRTF